MLEQLRELCAEVLGKGSPPFDGYAARALAIVHRSLVEECCAGAVVGRLPRLRPFMAIAVGGEWEDARGHQGVIPIADVGGFASLAEDVARTLLESDCPPCSGTTCDICEERGHDPSSPIAAAYTDAGGVRSWVLASAACSACDGFGSRSFGDALLGPGCPDCSGTGARTPVDQIARRYGGEGTARLARFETSP